MPDRPSIARVLDDAAGVLVRAGVLDPRREATELWAAVQGVRPGAVWLERDGEPAPPIARAFWAAVARRSNGVPFPYAVGRASFRSLELQLDSRALIPRPETEGLVELVLRAAGMRDAGCGMRGLAADIGTGSGCIALALAVEGNFERVIAIERSAEAATLARENVALVAPRTPVEVREGDLLEPLRGERCQVIVSNPPYLSEADYAALDASVKRYEPRAALASGPDGLEATRGLLAGAQALLEPGGFLAMEIDARRADQVRALACEYGWARLDIHNDLFGRARYALAVPRED